MFRNTLGKYRAVDVAPIMIEFASFKRPGKVRQETYTPRQLLHFESKVGEFGKASYIIRNKALRRTCALLVIPSLKKKDSDL